MVLETTVDTIHRRRPAVGGSVLYATRAVLPLVMDGDLDPAAFGSQVAVRARRGTAARKIGGPALAARPFFPAGRSSRWRCWSSPVLYCPSAPVSGDGRMAVSGDAEIAR